MTRCGFEASVLALFIKPLVAVALTHCQKAAGNQTYTHSYTPVRSLRILGRHLTSSSRRCWGDGGIQEVGFCQRFSQRPVSGGGGGGGGFLAAAEQMEISAVVLDSHVVQWIIPTLWPPLRSFHSVVCYSMEGVNTDLLWRSLWQPAEVIQRQSATLWGLSQLFAEENFSEVAVFAFSSNCRWMNCRTNSIPV